jgi:hypothetical protein
MFPSKEVLLIRIAEEANLAGVHTTILCIDKFQVNVEGIGKSFLVNANYGLHNGRWKVTKCNVPTGCDPYTLKEKMKKGKHNAVTNSNEPLPQPPEDVAITAFNKIGDMEEGTANNDAPPCEEADDTNVVKKPLLKSPIKSRWLVPLLKSPLLEHPNMSHDEMRLLLNPYVVDIFITDALLQSMYNEIRNIVFGDPRENVHNISKLSRPLEELGHDFEIYTRTQ